MFVLEQHFFEESVSDYIQLLVIGQEPVIDSENPTGSHHWQYCY